MLWEYKHAEDCELLRYHSAHTLPSCDKMILSGQYFTVQLFGGDRIRDESTDVCWHRNPDSEQQRIQAVQKSVQAAGMHQMQHSFLNTEKAPSTHVSSALYYTY